MPTFPLHQPATRTDKVKFSDGTTSGYMPPTNTMDPRYAACIDHHVACDCREADLREDIVEYRAEYHLLKAAIEKVVGDHHTWLPPAPNPNNTGADYEETPGCQCTGCEIVRLTRNKDFWRTVLR